MSDAAPNPKSQVICILGMHRSGTSLISRIVNLLGVYLGPEEETIRAAESNPLGFWEHRRLTALSDEILSRLGGSWHEPPIFRPDWEVSPALHGLRERARAVIDGEFAAAKPWAWKDPRTCLTLPFWQRLLPSMRYVICLRNPVDVAYSLERRDGFSLEKSVDLWLLHVVSSLRHTEGHPRLLLFYENFMAQPHQELRRLARYLGTGARAAEEGTQKAVREFLTAELQHHHTSLADTAEHPGLPYSAKALYLILRLADRLRPEEISGGAGAAPLFEEIVNGLAQDSIQAQSDLGVAELVKLGGQALDKGRALVSAPDRGEEGERLLDIYNALVTVQRGPRSPIAGTNTVISDSDTRLATIPRTRGQGALEHVRQVRDRLFPVGTWRRDVYWTLHRTVEVLVTVGPRAVALKTLRRARMALRGQRLLVGFPAHDIPKDLDAQYQIWLRRHRLTRRGVARTKATMETFAYAPLISIVMPVYDTDESSDRGAIESVRAQLYSRWELCLVSPASTGLSVRSVLKEYPSTDSRIRVEYLPQGDGVVAASNSGLSVARGEFVAFLDSKDELSADALFHIVKRLNEDRRLDLLYSDEDKVDSGRRHVEPFFKPDWSPDLLLSTNYLAHFSVFRRNLLAEVGGFRSGFDGNRDYDLVLRFTERTNRIAHIPEVLCHLRQVSAPDMTIAESSQGSGQRAIEDALRRRGLQGRVVTGTPGKYSVQYQLRGNPLVSIIIPSKDRWRLLEECLRSVETRTDYARYEIIILDNGSTEPDTLKYLDAIARRWRVHRCPGPFNFSAINNLGASLASGEYLLFLNNDTQVIRSDWLTAMLEQAQRREVGAVGAKLLYPDGTIQHAGVVLGIGGVAGHAFKGLRLSENAPTYFNLADVVRNCSAVTGACMMVPRRVFAEVEGFDERFRVAFNDVDFCLRLRERGYLVVYTPLALLYHHESATRGRFHPLEDEELCLKRWGDVIRGGDPYYNGNLTLSREDWSLRL